MIPIFAHKNVCESRRMPLFIGVQAVEWKDGLSGTGNATQSNQIAELRSAI